MSSGIEIEIKHNVSSSPGKQLRWVQTLSSNHPEIKKCGLPYIVDPFGSWDPNLHKKSLPGLISVCKADDLAPFYMTNTEFTSVGPNLYDAPKSPPPSSGRYWWKFITALAEVHGHSVHQLVAISWGYDRMHSGTVAVAPIYPATKVQLHKHCIALKKMYGSYSFS